MTGDDSVATVVETVDLISKKWHPAIIQTLLQSGPLRFSELKTSLDGVSGKVLTDSLNDLVESGLVRRTVVSESPKRVEYELTAHGRDLQEAIEALATWGDAHLGDGGPPRVLVVDDDPRLAEMHAGWLADRYDVETAYGGEAALRRLDDEVDVLVLDRRMPGIAGETVLERLGILGLDPGVVMLTAVEPEPEVAGMDIDDYVVKPALKKDVLEAVAAVLERQGLEDPVREYLALSARQALLEAETTPTEREHSEEYQTLLDRIEQLEDLLDDPIEGVEDESIRGLLADGC
ncbi:winged helix-turn-helix transcriptional regulator [Haloglomus halophilum]|uniref:winged helix-turn-helix transcriptional regulator n=1 Tax=Haloglomus halophilum TaxID=2962672 RepID=UPI0020C9C1BE|nr:winged helix-turn-helix transcriptional regulator [Haloglomus halophilum]